MRYLLLFFALIPNIFFGQNIMVKDLSEYLSSTRKDTVGYQFVLEQGDSIHSENSSVITIYNPVFRSLLQEKQELVFAPDGYEFNEIPLWTYLKWRYKTYVSNGKMKLLQGYIRAIPVIADMKPSGTLEDFLGYLKSKEKASR